VVAWVAAELLLMEFGEAILGGTASIANVAAMGNNTDVAAVLAGSYRRKMRAC
jgi:hypothetical protein